MVKKLLLLLLTGVCSGLSNASAQSAFKRQYARIAADRDSAIVLALPETSTYGRTNAPDGFGKKLEITASAPNELSFEKEHNTAWYLLNIHCDGELSFEIIPVDSTNDYDFLLFKKPASDTSCFFLKHPVRSNVRRNDSTTKGITGLKPGMKNLFQGPGPGIGFSRAIDVRAGEQYFLVLDNVYPAGSGHQLKFALTATTTLRGKALSEGGMPVAHALVLLSRDRDSIRQTTTDKNGSYIMNAPMDRCQPYTITVSDSLHMFAETVLEKGSCGADTIIKHVLKDLKAGVSYALNGINFYNGSAVLLPESLPSLRQLLRLMRGRPQLKISVEGHVTSTPRYTLKGTDANVLQHLSDERARKVFEYLQSQGIDASRMRTQGFSNRHMLYPDPKNEMEHRANRRVEIRVLSE